MPEIARKQQKEVKKEVSRFVFSSEFIIFAVNSGETSHRTANKIIIITTENNDYRITTNIDYNLE